MQAYDFEIEYVKGKNNVVVDALSRRLASLSLMSISTDWRSLLLVEYSKNKFSCELMDGQIQDDRYWIIDDIIYYKGRIYLIPESSLKRKIIQASHDSPLSGPQGFLKTYRQIRERFSWKGLKREVMQHLPPKRDRAHSSGGVTSATTNSRAEVGKYFHGLHYRVAQGTWTRLIICRGRSVDQICSFLCYLIRLFSNTGSRVIF